MFTPALHQHNFDTGKVDNGSALLIHPTRQASCVAFRSVIKGLCCGNTKPWDHRYQDQCDTWIAGLDSERVSCGKNDTMDCIPQWSIQLDSNAWGLWPSHRCHDHRGIREMLIGFEVANVPSATCFWKRRPENHEQAKTARQ